MVSHQGVLPVGEEVVRPDRGQLDVLGAEVVLVVRPDAPPDVVLRGAGVSGGRFNRKNLALVSA